MQKNLLHRTIPKWMPRMIVYKTNVNVFVAHAPEMYGVAIAVENQLFVLHS